MALFGGYNNILPSMLTIIPSSPLTSLVIYSCIPLKAIQYYINIIRHCVRHECSDWLICVPKPARRVLRLQIDANASSLNKP